jgi:hypothetical protein
MGNYADAHKANQALFEYLDGFHNPPRIQKGLAWRSPDEFEAAHHSGELTDADYTRLAEFAARRRQRRAAKRDVASSEASAKAEHPGPATATDAHRSTQAPHPGKIRRSETRPAPRADTAERARPSGRTLTTTKESRSTG